MFFSVADISSDVLLGSLALCALAPITILRPFGRFRLHNVYDSVQPLEDEHMAKSVGIALERSP
jgi:hypothetical protein